VDRTLLQADGREQLEHAFAQQVDRADLARHRFADDLHDPVQLRLRVGARSHDLVEARKDFAGGANGGSWHLRKSLTDWSGASNESCCGTNRNG
jgi:hypothetical protein